MVEKEKGGETALMVLGVRNLAFLSRTQQGRDRCRCDEDKECSLEPRLREELG